MNILEQIVAHKKIEVAQQKERIPLKNLEKYPLMDRQIFSLKTSLKNQERSGIIAEFKTKSPSKGIIRATPAPSYDRTVRVQEITKGYEDAGASAISVLTDEEFFAGSLEDLRNANQVTLIPLLRKDFMIDEYQIVEARANGADLILLIAACLSPQKLKELAQFAHQMGLEVLMEVHSQAELESHLNEHLDIIGVNNRDLKTFEVSIDTSLQLLEYIPSEMVKISESGISQPETIQKLRAAGYQGFLIGETFMKTENPAETCQELIGKLGARS